MTSNLSFPTDTLMLCGHQVTCIYVQSLSKLCFVNALDQGTSSPTLPPISHTEGHSWSWLSYQWSAGSP